MDCLKFDNGLLNVYSNVIMIFIVFIVNEDNAANDGICEGDGEGICDGDIDGEMEGFVVGSVEGSVVGSDEGSDVGSNDGSVVGAVVSAFADGALQANCNWQQLHGTSFQNVLLLFFAKSGEKKQL